MAQSPCASLPLLDIALDFLLLCFANRLEGVVCPRAFDHPQTFTLLVLARCRVWRACFIRHGWSQCNTRKRMCVLWINAKRNRCYTMRCKMIRVKRTFLQWAKGKLDLLTPNAIILKRLSHVSSTVSRPVLEKQNIISNIQTKYK